MRIRGPIIPTTATSGFSIESCGNEVVSTPSHMLRAQSSRRFTRRARALGQRGGSVLIGPPALLKIQSDVSRFGDRTKAVSTASMPRVRRRRSGFIAIGRTLPAIRIFDCDSAQAARGYWSGVTSETRRPNPRRHGTRHRARRNPHNEANFRMRPRAVRNEIRTTKPIFG